MTAVIECHQLAVGYDPDAPVLTDVELRIEAGEIVALLGPSGCGKSTLLRTLIGLLPPLDGEVLLFGEPLYRRRGEERRALVARTGTLFQQDALFGSMSVADNVALPLHELTSLPAPVIAQMAAMKLALVGLAGLGGRWPANLSGGQRKRAALARATILDPPVVFCDEPSAGLDPAVAAGIDETLLRLRSLFGSAFVVVSHELASIRAIADRGVMFGDGGIRAEGTIDELAASTDAAVHAFFHRIAAGAAEAR